MWQQWVNGVLGIIVFALAFGVVALDPATLSWTLGILGAAIAVLAFWGAAESAPTTRRLT